MGYTTPLLIVALVATASAGPAGLMRQRCATTCSDSTKFAFEKGMTYEYDYSVITDTRDFPLDSEDIVSVATKAKASVSVVAPCEFVLTLKDVSLEGSSHSSEFSSAVMKDPLRFSFNDGRIQELCSETEEAVWVTNFKRGVLSMFQNTMENFDKHETTSEVDIIGECDAEYKSVRDGDLVTIERTKSFETCKHLAMSSHTTIPSALQRMPMLTSRETCTQDIEAGIMKEVNCHQNLLLKPIAGADGVATTISSKLTLVSSTYGVSTTDFEMKKTTLEFDGSMIDDNQEMRIQTVEAILRELDEKSKIVLKAEIPELFSKLIDNLRHLDERQMQMLYESNKFSRVWRFLVDAAPMVATPASMAVVSDLVTSAQISQGDADVWFASMAFINKPEAAMFNKLAKAVKMSNSKQAMLGVSSMINSYCTINSNCMENESIREVLMEMEINLGSSCRSYSLGKRETILVTLKALGNAGRFVNHEILESCYTEKTVPAEVRVAALEADRRMPCDGSYEKLSDVFTDVREDYEIRIAAYLSMMACPTKELIDIIKSRLESEGVNHVGSFIWSHLTNLQETASHEKQWIRELIGEETLTTKYNSTALKFSRNYESSFYMEEQGLGSTIESNVIFSKYSILPRSGMLNLSVDIFGESMNLIEVGGRMEGFEGLIEKFFGPNGYYPEETVEAIVKGIRKSQTNDDVTTLEEMLETTAENQEGSYYVKVLGNDVVYHHFHGLENFFDSNVDFNFIGMIMELARTGKVDYTKSYNLVDTELNYPTISGFPLSLKLNGTATIGMRMDGKFSATSFRDMDIEGYVYPSASVQIDATMLIDAHVSKFGRKMSANMHTSNTLDGKIKINGGKLVDIKLNAPEDKIEIFSVKTKRVFVNDNIEMKKKSSNEEDVRNIDLTRPLGIKLIKKIESSADEFGVSYSIEKTDTQNSYNMKFVNEPSNIEFIIDTPGSNINRKLAFTAMKTPTDVNINIYTPIKTLSGIGTHQITNNGKKMAMELTVDETKKYKLSSEYSLSHGQTNKFNSFVTIESPDGVVLATRGLVEHNKEQRFMKIDFDQTGFMPASMKVQVGFSDTSKSLNADIVSPVFTTSMKGNVNCEENRKSSQFDGKYSIMNGPEQTFNKYFKFQKLSNFDERSYLIDYTHELSQFPSFGMSIQGKYSHTHGKFETMASVQAGSGVFDLDFTNNIGYDIQEQSKAYQVNMALKSSSHGIDFLRNENFKLRSNYLLRESFTRFFTNFEVTSKVELGYFRDTEAFARLSFGMPNFDMSHEYSYTKIADKYYTAKVLTNVKDFKMALDGSFQDKTEPGQIVNLLMGTKLNVNGNKRNAEFGLKVDHESLSLDATAVSEGQEKFVKIRGNLNSLKLESNIIQPLLLNAQLVSNPSFSASITGHWGTTEINTNLAMETKMISGVFRYGEMEKNFRVEVLDNGMKAEVTLSPTEIVKFTTSYDMNNGLYFTVTLDTPFTNYEKQDLVINFKRSNSQQIEGQINVTWRNEQVFVLTTKTDVSMNTMSDSLNFDASITCSRQIFGMERFRFMIKHVMSNYDIDSVITGTLDGNDVIVGKLISAFKSGEHNMNAMLKTPFTDDFQIKCFANLQTKGEYSMTYGTMNIHSNYIIEKPSNDETKFAYELTSSLFNDFRFDINVKKTENDKTFKIDGQYGEQKYMAVFTHSKELCDQGMNVQSTGRVILPNRPPITGSLTTTIKNTSGGKRITSDLEMARFWTNYGSMKIHNDVRFVSKTNIQTLTSVTSPDVRASLEAMFKYENINLDSFVKYSFNGYKGNFTANGKVDIANKKASIITTVITKDDVSFKVDFDYEFTDNKHITKIKAKCGSTNYNIHHEFTMTNELNWTNELYVNEYYFKNIMKYAADTVSHIIDWNLNSKFVRGDLSYKLKYEPLGINFWINGKVSTSWSLDTDFDMKYNSGDGIYQPEIKISYGRHTVNIISIFKNLDSEISLVSDFVSSFYDEIHFEMKTDPRFINGIHIALKRGESITEVDLSGNYTSNEKSAMINVKSSSLPSDIKIEARHTLSGDEKIVNIDVTTNEKNSVNIVYSGTYNKGKLSSKFNLPCVRLIGASFEIDYEFTRLPYVLNGELNIMNKNHSAKITFDNKSCNVNLDVEGTDVELRTEWSFNEANKIVNIMTSSDILEFIFTTKCSVNIENNDFELITKYNSETIFAVTANHEEMSSKYEAQVLYWYKTLYKASITYDDSKFNGYFSMNDRKLEIAGNHNFNSTTGNFLCNINSTFNGFNKVSFNGNYDFGSVKNVGFNAKANDDEIGVKVTVDIINMQAPTIEIHIKTFLDAFKTVGMKANYNIQSETITSLVKINHNNDQYEYKMEAKREQFGKGEIVVEAKTSTIGNELMKFGFSYDFTGTTFKANVFNVRNQDSQNYSIDMHFNSNSITGILRSPIGQYAEISFDGSYTNGETELGYSTNVMINNSDKITVNGKFGKNVQSPEFILEIETPYENYSSIKFALNGNMKPQDIEFSLYFGNNNNVYSANMVAKQMYKKGEIRFDINTPMVGYSKISMNGEYNFLDDVKHATIDYEENGRKEKLAIDLAVNDNHFVVNVVSPVPNFETLSFEGNFTNSENRREVVAKLTKGSEEYNFEGSVDVARKQFIMRGNMPNTFELVEIVGKKTSTGFLLTSKFNNNVQEMKFDYNIEPTAASYRLQTPFAGYNILSFDYQMKMRPGSMRTSIKFQKDDFTAEFEGKIQTTDLKSIIIVTGSVPKYDQDLSFNASYDFTDNTKFVTISGKYNTHEEKLELIMRYDTFNAEVNVVVPFINKNVGAKYIFNIETENMRFDGSLTAHFDDEVFNFSSSGEINSNMLKFNMSTPFDKIENIEVLAIINRSQSLGNMKIVFGEHEISVLLNYTLHNFVFEVVSPFQLMKLVKVASTITNLVEHREMNISANYNDNMIKFVVGYKPGNVFIEVKRNDEVSKISISGELEQEKAALYVSIQTPFDDMKDIDFTSKVDVSGFDKFIEITLKKENDVKMIALSGKFINDEAELKIKTPFIGFENFQTRGSLSRSKRSLEFMMMKDTSIAEIHANFNSLNINVKTPYEAARESSLTVQRTDAGGLELHYKRGDNYIDLTAVPTGRRRSFDITVGSAFPGWEYLALAGRLDKDELVGYLSGQINEDRMTIQGGGKYSRVDSNLTFDITTPYVGYESINFKLKFNVRRNQFTYDMKSSTSQFRIFVSTVPNFNVDIYVPNSEEPTIITANMSIFNSNIKISSRFPKIRSFNLEWKFDLGKGEVEINQRIEYNGLEVLKVEFKRGGGTAHLKIDARRGDNHSMIHFHRSGFEELEFVFNRNGKEFKAVAQGSGNLPIKGTIDIVINNSFREVPRTVTGKFELDRTGSPKTAQLELVYPGNKLYVINVSYNIDLSNPTIGDYKISIVTPERRARPWQNINGSWDFTNHDSAVINFGIQNLTITARGKFGLHESDFTVTTSKSSVPYIVQWRFYKTSTPEQRTRDYYLKLGTADKFIMAKLKGTFNGELFSLKNGNAEIEFQSPSMGEKLSLNMKWQRDQTGLSGDGSFTFGENSGTFNINRLKRFADTRSLELSFEANTNIPDFTKITVEGSYSFNNEAVIKLDIKWDNDNISINFNINDITSEFTQQTASFSLPGYDDITVEFGHDFRNKKARKFTATAQIAGQESFIKAEWNRNKEFTKLSGTIDAQSHFLGTISVVGSYDVRNFNNAKAEIHYKRNDDKFVNIEWSRVFNSKELNAQVVLESHFERLPVAKIVVQGQFEGQFKLDALLQINTIKVTYELLVVPNSITGKITSPIPGFEEITGSLTYDFSDRKKKTAQLRYVRGDRTVDMDFDLDIPNRRSGQLSLTLATPFEIVRTLTANASWKNKKGEVHYKRNDIEYHFEGEADVKSEQSSFEVTFSPPGQDPVKVSLEFNSGSFIDGKGTEPEKIAKVELGMLGKRIEFELEGFRNSERIMVHLDVESTFEAVREFEVKLDSELNTEQRDGLFEITINDFHFRMRNHFERKADGYYFKTEIDSSLTPLPGLILGFGLEGDERILTVGLGEDRELTVSFVSKNNFRNGFSGKLSLPKRGIEQAAYDVNYSFSGNNVLNIDVKVEIEPGKVIEADIIYNSDGVRARLQSPRGKRSARMRRSISDNKFFVDVGVDDYSISFMAEKILSNKGFLIEGEVFGNKISIDSLFLIDGIHKGDARFLVSTNIQGYEKLGGIIAYRNGNGKIQGRAEMNLPSYITPRMSVNVDFDTKNALKGLASIDISGQVFTVQTDLNGNMRDGYNGYMKLNTPFHSASEVTIDGTIQTNLSDFNIQAKISHPRGSYNVSFRYNVKSSENITSDAKLECNGNTVFLFGFNANLLKNNIESHLSINEHKMTLDVQYSSDICKGTIFIDSIYIGAPVEITLTKAGYPTSDKSYQGTVTTMGQSHSFSVSYKIINTGIDVSMVVQSSIIGGRKMFTLSHEMPSNYMTESFAIQMSYIAEFNYDLVVEVDRTNGFSGSVMLTRPLGVTKFQISGFKENNKFGGGILLNTPFSQNDATLNVEHSLYKVNYKILGKLALNFDTSYGIHYKVKLDRSETKSIVEQFLNEHYNKVGYSYTTKGVLLVVDFNTRLFNIGSGSFVADVRANSNAKRAIVKLTRNDEIHTCDLKVDMTEVNAVAILKSPYIAGEVAKAEVSATGSVENMLMEAMVRYNKKMLGTKFNLEAKSPNDIKCTLELKTPFKGYRKLNFGASFAKDSFTTVNFYALQPIGYKFELKTGKSVEEFVTEIDIETPIDGFEVIAASVRTPLVKIAPKLSLKLPNTEYGMDVEVEKIGTHSKISGNLNLNGLKYGAGLGYRNSPPFEFSYYTKTDDFKHNFHIMMDSSVFSVFSFCL